MVRIGFITFVGAVLFVASGWAQGVSASKSTEKRSFAAGASHTLERVVANIPSAILSGEEKEAFTEYLRLLGGDRYGNDFEIGSSNRGLEAYFQDLWGSSDRVGNLNQCFRDRALGFYADVSLHLKGVNKTSGPKEGEGLWEEVKEGARRPSLFSKAGEGDKAHLQSGWLWKTALKHSNGNADAALHLIGFCGHDDLIAGSFLYTDASEAAKEELRTKLARMEGLRNELEEKKRAALQHPDPSRVIDKASLELSDVLGELKYLRSATTVQRAFRCPHMFSDFFLPGGLGAEVDISNDLKAKINRTQNPDGHLKIPAKHYHIYGSALMVCRLIANGFDPEKAIKVQKQAARFYRGARICEASNKLLGNKAKIDKAVAPLLKEGKTMEEAVWEVLQDDDDLALGLFGNATLAVLEDRELARRKIKNTLVRMDAAQLYRLWYVGAGEVLTGDRLWCSDVRLGGPKDLLDVNNSLLSWFQRPKGWSKERYDAAAKHLATWDVDFEWTIAEHEAGAKFAAESCKKKSPGENPFQTLCDANTAKSQATPEKPVR